MKNTYELDMQDADQFLTLLHTLSDMGAAMRKVMGQALTSTSLYKDLTEGMYAPLQKFFENVMYYVFQKKFLTNKHLKKRIAVINTEKHSNLNYPSSYNQWNSV